MQPVFTQDAIVYPIIQHPREGVVTPDVADALALAAYLGSWHHSQKMRNGMCEAHPGDDRTRAALGWDQDRLTAAARVLRSMGLWRRYASQSTVEGWAWTLPVDLTPVPRIRTWYTRSKEIEAALKVIVRLCPELSSEARVLAVIMIARLVPQDITQQGTAIARSALQALLLGIDIDAAFEELAAADVMVAETRGEDRFVIASLTSAFITRVHGYMDNMKRTKLYGRHGETALERNVLREHGAVVLNRRAEKMASNEPRKEYFYLIRDPHDRLCDSFYAGITTDPEARARSHREFAGTGDGMGTSYHDKNWESNPGKRAAFEEIAAQGLEPYMEVVTPGVAISRTESRQYERMLVQALFILGMPLTNIEYIRDCRLPRVEDADSLIRTALRGFGLDTRQIETFLVRVHLRQRDRNVVMR